MGKPEFAKQIKELGEHKQDHINISIHPAAVDANRLRAHWSMRLSGTFGVCGYCCH